MIPTGSLVNTHHHTELHIFFSSGYENLRSTSSIPYSVVSNSHHAVHYVVHFQCIS